MSVSFFIFDLPSAYYLFLFAIISLLVGVARLVYTRLYKRNSKSIDIFDVFPFANAVQFILGGMTILFKGTWFGTLFLVLTIVILPATVLAYALITTQFHRLHH